jgi:peroxiredoxin
MGLNLLNLNKSKSFFIIIPIAEKKQMIKGCFLILLTLLSFNSFCQKTISISGKLKMKPGTTIRIWRYTDNICFERQILFKTKTKSDSTFQVSIPIAKTELINISANEFTNEILFTPNQDYVIDLIPSANQSQKVLQILSIYKSLNSQDDLIKAYEIISDSTISLLFGHSNQRPTLNNIKQFNAAIDKGLRKVENSYCRDLIQSLRIHFLTLSRAYSFSTALTTYFHCENLPLDNPAFQSLISENFQDYFKSGPSSITQYNFFTGIADSIHFNDLLKLLSDDPSLSCISIREMVLLCNLYSMIRNGELKPEKGNNLLKEGAEKSSNPINRQLADNLMLSLFSKKPGTSLPDFSLVTPEGNLYNLSNFKGKPLHITFFSFKGLADRNLLNQLTDVAHFADSLGVAKFICITTDQNREEITKFWNEKKYPMQLYFAPDDYEIFDFFNINSLPSFLLLDAEGNINSVAPNFPGELLLKQIISLHPAENHPMVNPSSVPKQSPSFLQDRPSKK